MNTGMSAVPAELPRIRQYSLFVEALPRCDEIASLMERRIATSRLRGTLRVERKASEEMAQVTLEAGDIAPNVILERAVAGPTSVVIQFTTIEAILAELESLDASW
jgi:hypothetical protein